MGTFRVACVASVSSRVIARKLSFSFFALVPTFLTNSRWNACCAGCFQGINLYFLGNFRECTCIILEKVTQNLGEIIVMLFLQKSMSTIGQDQRVYNTVATLVYKLFIFFCEHKLLKNMTIIIKNIMLLDMLKLLCIIHSLQTCSQTVSVFCYLKWWNPTISEETCRGFWEQRGSRTVTSEFSSRRNIMCGNDSAPTGRASGQ